MSKSESHTVNSPEEMQALGATLAGQCTAPSLIFLHGNLGAGKTTFVRGFLTGLGYRGHVKSPTYTLVEPYSFSNFVCYHFDLYRLKYPEELEEMGVRDYLSGNSICLIEWPEKAQGVLPGADIEILFSYFPSTESDEQANKRFVKISC